MKANMQAQMAFQKDLILKQRQAQMATQIAMGRERLNYYAAFYLLSAALMIMAALKKKNPALIGPLVPLSFVLLFQYDMCYGNMMERIRSAADELITNNPYKFYLPEHSGIVTVEEYERIIGVKIPISERSI